ncbi:hypothetical protein [Niallia circulans]|uniref:hypothetical protein n=1 Tax=Niallia circulans TaxID=1397 RepID=UPI000AE39EA9|nr:hypothetical protein [Niallia circulans]
MCNLCNGKRVVHEFEAYGIRYKPCPNCPPITKEFHADLDVLKERIKAFKKEMSAVGS